MKIHMQMDQKNKLAVKEGLKTKMLPEDNFRD